MPSQLKVPYTEGFLDLAPFRVTTVHAQQTSDDVFSRLQTPMQLLICVQRIRVTDRSRVDLIQFRPTSAAASRLWIVGFSSRVTCHGHVNGAPRRPVKADATINVGPLNLMSPSSVDDTSLSSTPLPSFLYQRSHPAGHYSGAIRATWDAGRP